MKSKLKKQNKIIVAKPENPSQKIRGQNNLIIDNFCNWASKSLNNPKDESNQLFKIECILGNLLYGFDENGYKLWPRNYGALELAEELGERFREDFDDIYTQSACSCRSRKN